MGCVLVFGSGNGDVLGEIEVGVEGWKIAYLGNRIDASGRGHLAIVEGEGLDVREGDGITGLAGGGEGVEGEEG